MSTLLVPAIAVFATLAPLQIMILTVICVAIKIRNDDALRLFPHAALPALAIAAFKFLIAIATVVLMQMVKHREDDVFVAGILVTPLLQLIFSQWVIHKAIGSGASIWSTKLAYLPIAVTIFLAERVIVAFKLLL